MASSSSDGEVFADEVDGGPTHDPYEEFVNSQNVKDTFDAFQDLCYSAGVVPFEEHGRESFEKLKAGVASWKAKKLWDILDKRANRKEYDKGKACADTKVLIVGAGPCGLRAAIELALLGAKVVVAEKRDSFTRHNVLYLWPYLMTDLTNLGMKKFYGRFSTGSINHISIIKLQIILLKIALLVGVEVHHSVQFVSLDEKRKKDGWRANVKPKDHRVSKFEFDVIIAADGRQETLPDFEWKESARTLAIGITANFVNNQTNRDAETKEISGKSYIYDQEFFDGLKEKKIQLENIVYYKDETHYFVMTAKKQSLIEKGVIKKDENDASSLLAPTNVNEKKLQEFALEAALYATEGKLPTKEFAKNYRGKPDIAMFDFTSRKQATRAAIIREEDGGEKRLIMAVVGDSCKEPFWPEGTGCALGFLSVFDTVWMIRTIATGERTVEEALKNREVIYKLLSNTKQEDLSKDFVGYGIDPRTRYTSQTARSPDLYKPVPKREYVRRNSSCDTPKSRTVSEYIDEDRKNNPSVRPRLKSTPAFGSRSKGMNIREVDEQGAVGKKRWSLKRRRSEQKKEDKKAEQKGKNTKDAEEKKGEKTKGVPERKYSKLKTEKKDRGKTKDDEAKQNEKNPGVRDSGKRNKAKETKDEKKTKEKKSKEFKEQKKEEKRKAKEVQKDKKGKDGKGKKGVNNGDKAEGSPANGKRTEGIQDRINRLESPRDVTSQDKFKSLDRREISFSDAKKKFSEQETPSSAPAISRSSSSSEESLNQTETRSVWDRIFFWRHSKNTKEEDQADSPKKKRKRLRLKKKYKRAQAKRRTVKEASKQNKAGQKQTSYHQLGSESPPSPAGHGDGHSSHRSSSVGSKASSQGPTTPSRGLKDPTLSPSRGLEDSTTGDEIDGGEAYSRLSDSDETIHKQQQKSESRGSILRRIRSGKKKAKDYDRMQMETERPMGAK